MKKFKLQNPTTDQLNAIKKGLNDLGLEYEATIAQDLSEVEFKVEDHNLSLDDFDVEELPSDIEIGGIYQDANIRPELPHRSIFMHVGHRESGNPIYFPIYEGEGYLAYPENICGFDWKGYPQHKATKR